MYTLIITLHVALAMLGSACFVAVIATLPLTDNEQWTDMPPGTLWHFEEGIPVNMLATKPGPVKKPAAACGPKL